MSAEYFTIQGIPSSEVDSRWPEVERWVSPACAFSNGALYPEDVKQACRNRDYQLWVLVRDGMCVGCFTTKVSTWPNGRKTLEVPVLGGDGLDAWLGGVVHLLKGFAKDQGCDSVMASGRPGWDRELRKYGWKLATVTMITEV